MKKIILAIAILCAVSINAQESASYKQKTIEFIKLTGTSDAFENAIDQIGLNVPEDKKEAYKKEAMGTLDGLYEKIAELYMKEFTEAEISELIAFYKTDLGKKLASKQTTLSQSSMMLGQTWGMEIGQMAQNYAKY
ncbi:MAG: DUF2059 domain-containing protein [Bacteroidota bacterium]